MKSIAVFCASDSGKDVLFQKMAFQTGKEIAKNKLTLIYGGAKVGLMGSLADGALSEGGKIIGVLPRFLAKREIAHPNLTEIIYVKSMEERKKIVHELSEASITLPGGIGSMEEIFEKLSGRQLELHDQPIGLLNASGYYDALLGQLDLMVENGFLNPVTLKYLMVDTCPISLISKVMTKPYPIL